MVHIKWFVIIQLISGALELRVRKFMLIYLFIQGMFKCT